eukprot:gene35488-47715_t
MEIAMGLDHIRLEIEHMRRQIQRQRGDILKLQRSGIDTGSADALLGRMQEKVDALCAERDRLVGEERRKYPGTAKGVMDNLRRFSRPWSMEEGESCFTVVDASGLLLVTVRHREDLHGRHDHDACGDLSRDEARRIARAIVRLPDLLTRPPY